MASIEFDETLEGKQPRLFHQRLRNDERGLLHRAYHTPTSSKLYMRYNLQEGVANQVSGQPEEPRVTPSANVTNPTLLQTFGLKRWVEMSPLDEDGNQDGSVQPHTTGLLAVSSGPWTTDQLQLVQRNRVSDIGADQDVTKMDQATWEGYLGYLTMTQFRQYII